MNGSRNIPPEPQYPLVMGIQDYLLTGLSPPNTGKRLLITESTSVLLITLVTVLAGQATGVRSS